MPGGRLTYEDRLRIAAGLADGLGYAEIARHLGRPTSTISREVSRNLGTDGYQPERAHQATEQRARRDKPVRPEAPLATGERYGRDPQAIQDFAGQFTGLMVETGMPRMMARVLACLHITDSGSLTAAELVQLLQVSPASISAAISYLEGLELVERHKDANQRRERYVIDDGIWLRSLLASAKATGSWSSVTRRGVAIFGQDTPTGTRLDEISQFFDYMTEQMVKAVHDWQERRGQSTMD
ncbi:DNA-binding transcriptional ArsR family regulator [Kibdelosporangium banguiense]|uniref:DNA-binding transcriptional ArsR family regulator n=1 Tax=Kibdelosporangium banguiense TaxID=1365924 RepID=A0ABS4TFX8_9PSEU|nr:helix-turn-helix domain-containing protein [Kibdelosporangium banguiense]MBP2323241.1 DNA-binding transcriptional ArsR family regulator [Kibdelosporangium banguiense]